MNNGRRISGSIPRVLFAALLVAVSFAHRPVMATGAPSVDMAAFVLPDGTLPVLCLTGGTPDKRSRVAGSGCEFCRLSVSASLPEPPEAFLTTAARRVVPGVAVRSTVTPTAFPPSAPPRGPPADPA